MDEGELRKMLERSLCFGVYVLPESSSDIAGQFLVSGEGRMVMLTAVQGELILSRLVWRG